MITPQIIEQEPERLDFYTALMEVVRGERITRLSWENKPCYGLLKDSILTLFIDGEFKQWLVSEGDITGTDWIIYEGEE